MINSIYNDYPAAIDLVKADDYDLIININSIRFLHDPGWKIEYNETNGLKKADIKNAVESSKMTIVSVLGNSNRGKTHILHKLSGVNLKAGYQIQTKGLSIKIYRKDIILLDTAGANAPLLLETENRPNQNEIEHIHLCQIITNYILQAFVIKQAHVLICVIGMLTTSEQSYLNKIKKFSKNKKKLIIIHNLIKCTTLKEMEKYKNEVLLKMIANNLEERDIPTFGDGEIPLFNKYFIEKDDEDVMHFIYGNDDPKNKELSFYNESTLNFIMKYIKVQVIKPVNIIENLKTHIKEISSLVLKEEIESLDDKNEDIIKSKNEIKPKDILYDGGDDIIFIGKEFEPKYRYYKKEDSLIIEIELCSDYSGLSVKQLFDKNTKETLFKITGERKIDSGENKEIYFTFGNKRENYKRFKLELKIKLKELGIGHLKEGYKEGMKFGILFLDFKFNK